jgi:hypothetical protein
MMIRLCSLASIYARMTSSRNHASTLFLSSAALGSRRVLAGGVFSPVVSGSHLVQHGLECGVAIAARLFNRCCWASLARHES